MSKGDTWTRGAVTAAALTMAVSLAAQTEIKLPKNKYSPQQDVALGREGAAEVRKQYPIIKNDAIASYLTMLGDRLVAAAPPELKQPVYEFSFTPVNLKEINAFALPGGPMFVHRGMFDAAAGEAEVAGVMAHELSHVLLRHGTANATKAANPWLQLGQVAGQVGGAMVGGAVGSVIAQGSEFSLGTMMLRYSRDFEKQADILGAQIMARAGYDPRALAHMFETIGRQSAESGGTPQWMSSHPNPGNRTEYITKEAALLTIAAPADDTGFARVRTAFASIGPAKSMGDLARATSSGGTHGLATEAAGGSATGNAGARVAPPSSQYRTLKGGSLFQAAIPSNWTAIPSKNSIRAVPGDGSNQASGQTAFSQGVEFGVAPASTRDLQQATQAFLNAVAQGNPGLRLGGTPQSLRMSQRSAIATPLTNQSTLGGQEQLVVYTTFLADGNLFYYLTVSPERDASVLQETFQRIGSSIQLTDAR